MDEYALKFSEVLSDEALIAAVPGTPSTTEVEDGGDVVNFFLSLITFKDGP